MFKLSYFVKYKYELIHLANVIMAAILGAAIALLLTGCGSVTKSSRHDIVASGEITVTQRITVDASVCDVFTDPVEKQECVKALVDALSKQEDGAGGVE